VYSTFVVEQRHGFNKQTPAFYAKDQLKKFVVGQLIQAPILAGIIKARRPHFTIYFSGIILFLKRKKQVDKFQCCGTVKYVLRFWFRFRFRLLTSYGSGSGSSSVSRPKQAVFTKKIVGKKSCLFNVIRSSIVVFKLFISSFEIPFYYGSGSAKAKSYGDFLTVLVPLHKFFQKSFMNI
jgi:hypothetical protein